MSSSRHGSSRTLRLSKDWIGERKLTNGYNVANFDPAKTVPQFDPEEVVKSVEVLPTLLLPADPARILVHFFQPAFFVGTGVAVKWGNGDASNNYLVLPIAGGLVFEYNKYGAICGYPWYGIAQGAPSTIVIWSERYVP